VSSSPSRRRDVRRALVWALAWALAFPAGATAQAPPVVEITGASRAEFDEATGVWTVEGQPATVTRGRAVLRAPRIRYDQRSRIVAADGGAELTEPGLRLFAGRAEYHLSDERVRAAGQVHIVSTREAPPVEVRALEAEGLLSTRRFVATGDAVLVRGDAQLSGRRLDYDETARVAVATGAPAARVREAVLTADVITVLLVPEVLQAEGTAVVRRGDLVGSARRMEIRAREDTVFLIGGAQLVRGRDRATAEEIQAALDGSRVVARGGARVVVDLP
jgi:lipopolysaccharide export system protein LptA